MLFPLQPGYTMTVWAETSDQLATTKTSSVKRNMMNGRGGVQRRRRSGFSILLFCDAAMRGQQCTMRWQSTITTQTQTDRVRWRRGQ
jgi:hypothetical protein